MDVINALAIIAFAALIHTSFQLSVSVFTLLSGHAIGRKTAHNKLLRLTSGFLAGTTTMTILLLSFITLALLNSFGQAVPQVIWAMACGLLIGLGLAVWVFYYRREPGTSLWLPRGIARYLTDRTKATKNSGEAFGLGLSSVIAELVFILPPMLISSLVLTRLEPLLQLAGIAIYAGVSALSLVIVSGLVGSGHKLSRIQKWRETNKRFLQFAAGSGLLILGFYVYIVQASPIAALVTGGF